MLKKTLNSIPIRFCADIIAIYKNQIVLIERVNDNFKLALPGGGQEENELLSYTAIREMKEETGLSIKIMEVLGTYTNHAVGKHWHTISTVFIAKASGKIQNEKDKTKVVLFNIEDLKGILKSKLINKKFAYHHDIFLKEYFQKYYNIKEKG